MVPGPHFLQCLEFFISESTYRFGMKFRVEHRGPIFDLGLSYREILKIDPKNDPFRGFENFQYATGLQKYGTGRYAYSTNIHMCTTKS